MRTYFLVLVLIGLTASLKAQQTAPAIEWQKCLGGTGDDRPEVVIRTADSGLLIVGYTSSNDGDVTGFHGGTTDGWVVKLSAAGDLLWQKAFGGSGNEYFKSVAATNDGNYVMAGSTTSNDGDVSGNHGSVDMWVVKISPTGDLLWQKCLGGSEPDSASSIREFSDGRLWIIGTTRSNNGDVSGLHTSVPLTETDIWVVKLEGNGTFITQKCFGGSKKEEGYDLVESDNGNFIISAKVYSNDGDFGFQSNNPEFVNVIKIDAANTMIWQTGWQRANTRYLTRKGDQVYVTTSFKFCNPSAENNGIAVNCFTDDPSYTFAPPDVDMLLEAYCAASPGAPPGPGYDVYGAGSTSIFSDLNNTMAGSTENPSGLSGYHGNGDGYLVNFQKNADGYWKKLAGGSNIDVLMSVINLSETELLAVGYTKSNDGDVSGNHGDADWWVIRLGKTNIIKGSVFYDYNSNGIKDTDEPFVNKVQVKSTKAGVENTGSTFEGSFSISVDTGAYVTTIVSPDSNYVPAPDARVSSFSTWNNIDSISFGLRPKPVRDYAVMGAVSSIMPNADLPFIFSYSNVGTDTLFNKTVTFIKDPRLVFVSSSPPPTTINGDTLTWDISMLSPGQSAYMPLSFFALGPPSLNKGDTIRYLAFIDSTGDQHPADNKWVDELVITVDPAPYTDPAQPVITGLQNEYCSDLGNQKIKITNLPDTLRVAKVSAKLDNVAVAIAADSTFSFNVNTLTAGEHIIQIVYSNPSYTKTGNFTFAVAAKVTPDVNVTASAVQISDQTAPVIVKAVNASGGGKNPLYTFAWDRNFTNPIQAESAKDSISLQPGSLAMGDNWYFVRMKTSSTCYTVQSNTDSIKIRRDQPTGIVDIDNPGRIINVYPNPFKTQLMITGLNAVKQYMVTITSLEGRLLYTRKISNRSSVELPSVPGAAGIYWLTLYDAARSRRIGSIQLIKQ